MHGTKRLGLAILLIFSICSEHLQSRCTQAIWVSSTNALAELSENAYVYIMLRIDRIHRVTLSTMTFYFNLQDEKRQCFCGPALLTSCDVHFS